MSRWWSWCDSIRSLSCSKYFKWIDSMVWSIYSSHEPTNVFIKFKIDPPDFLRGIRSCLPTNDENVWHLARVTVWCWRMKFCLWPRDKKKSRVFPIHSGSKWRLEKPVLKILWFFLVWFEFKNKQNRSTRQTLSKCYCRIVNRMARGRSMASSPFLSFACFRLSIHLSNE